MFLVNNSVDLVSCGTAAGTVDKGLVGINIGAAVSL